MAGRPSDDVVIHNPLIDKQLTEYILSVTGESKDWWDETVGGTSGTTRRGQLEEYRLRYNARRSVAELYKDAKDDPFPMSSNIGIGIEQIFGEFLIPTFLANGHDLEPMLQVEDKRTGKIDDTLTKFHDSYQRETFLKKRSLLEESNREILAVGGVFHKWLWTNVWRQQETEFPVWQHPLSGQPIMAPDGAGGMAPIPADSRTPEEAWPVDPSTGIKLKIMKLPSVRMGTIPIHEGPILSVRPYDAIEFPTSARSVDANDWDWMADNFTVTPYWFLGREGDPFEGKLQNLPLLWKWLGIDPNQLVMNPDRKLTTKVHLKEFHGKFPVTKTGKPIEIIGLMAPEAKILLAWRPSKLRGRPYFNRQVFSRGGHPMGKGIPETVYGLRNAIDATVNQEMDTGNMLNHPPMLLSTLAMLEDEDYEQVGPGSQWIMSDITGAKFLAPPVSRRDPVQLTNWFISMTQRIWGVTDINLGAPTDSLSPNISTARGVMTVVNQGNIKFSHLVRRLAETDSAEYEFVHFMFRDMLANPRTVAGEDGNPIEIKPQEREKFFRDDVRIKSVGNGLSTNPMIRQKTVSEAMQLMKSTENPFVQQDLEVLHDLTQQYLSAFGLKLNIKDNKALQDQQIIAQLLQTPVGSQLISQAVQMSIQQLKAQQTAGAPGQNGAGANGGMPNGNPGQPV